MSVEIKVPALGESVTEATVGKWTKKEGDFVKVDELLVELETDKVTMEVTAPASGVIEKITAKQGDTVGIGALLGSIKDGAAPVASKQESKPVAAAEVAVNKTLAPSSNTAAGFMMPSAKKMAVENNLSESNLSGTGKDGRITKGDVINALENPSTATTSKASSSRNEERVKMTRLRKRIAERLKESQNNAAILTTFNEVDMTNIMNLRNQYKESFEKKHKVKLGFMSFFVKAAVTALKEIPAVNAEIDGDDIIYKNYYDIGVAVGTEQGLVVPIVRDAEQKSFAEIEQEIVNLGKKARDGKLTMAELTGGTFSISNGGVYGSLLSTPIINPPQSGILGMHKTMERPMAVNGKVEIRPMMYLALSYDHRIIDGKEAVTFLVRIKECIENPERLLFDL
ncbi:MAG: 2-oxoglutarate dehydrogenase complex dihydrolipoyllysine-residue succinyltransferase [Sphingobacteriia bacterium]|nr:2-oxoglutarate dehydrogenase complex dihydrolipoyllysine-residue succinyltransferase [Sphingobacteriia bacterium]